MEYMNRKLHFNRYKNESGVTKDTTIFSNIAQEMVRELLVTFGYSLDNDISLWLIRLMSLNPKYCISPKRTIDRIAIDEFIAECMKIVLGEY